MTHLESATGRHIGKVTLYVFGALGGILFGYDQGIIAGVLPSIKHQWGLQGVGEGLVVAAVAAGAVIGAVLSARINDRFGRRRTIQLAGVIALVGSLLSVVAQDPTTLGAARIVIGIGVGLSSSTVPTYLSELSPPAWRGAIGALNQIFIVLGILIAFITGYLLGGSQDSSNWRWMLAGAAVPAIVLVLGLVLLPETPRWLVQHGRTDEAWQVLQQTQTGDEDIEAEMSRIREVITVDSGATSRFRDLWTPMVRPMLIVAVLLAVGQQFCGVNAINAYFPTMLIGLGFTAKTALFSGVLLGVTKFVFTGFAALFVDRWGRKPLLLIGNLLMAVTLVGSGISALAGGGGTAKGWLVMVFTLLYLAGYELGWGAVVWVMMSEVFPLKDRAAGMGVATVVLWASTGIVTAVFPVVSADGALGLGGAMLLFAGINVVLFGLTKWLVPETKGRSLEEIELDLRGRQPVSVG